MDYQSDQSWLSKTINVQSIIYWPWRHSLRLVVLTTVPLTIGMISGHLIYALLVCIGGLLAASGVQTDPYRERFYRIFGAVPFGVVGYLWGSFIGDHGVMTVVGVVFIALIAGWVSFWGKTFSSGSLQMLVMTVVGAHTATGSISILMPALFACGSLFAAILLGMEASLIPKLPERKLTSKIFDSLSKLASSALNPKAESADFKSALENTIQAQANAYRVVINASALDGHGQKDPQTGKKLLTLVDRLTVLIAMRTASVDILQDAEQVMGFLAHKILKPSEFEKSIAIMAGDNEVLIVLKELQLLLRNPLSFETTTPSNPIIELARDFSGLRSGGLRAQFEAQRDNFVNISALGLCMFIAMVAEYYFPGDRSYWIPLSVAVILKPDFGSVFTRAVQRSIGTLIGVLIAIVVFYFVPKGYEQIFFIGLFSALIPWASLKNYAWQCAFLTPLVLILIDMIIPGRTIDYGPQRLVDTVVGALIVLVFGYFIWPKPVKVSFASRYMKLLNAVTAYIQAVNKTNQSSDAFDNSLDARHSAYVELFSIRKWAQSFLSEPPSSQRQALKWFSRINDAEKVIENLGSYVVECDNKKKAPDDKVVDAFQADINKLAKTIKQTQRAAPTKG